MLLAADIRLSAPAHQKRSRMLQGTSPADFDLQDRSIFARLNGPSGGLSYIFSLNSASVQPPFQLEASVYCNRYRCAKVVERADNMAAVYYNVQTTRLLIRRQRGLIPRRVSSTE